MERGELAAKEFGWEIFISRASKRERFRNDEAAHSMSSGLSASGHGRSGNLARHTEVLLPAESFERQLLGLFYDNTRPRARARDVTSGKSIRFEVPYYPARHVAPASISKSSTKLQVRRETECADGDYA